MCVGRSIATFTVAARCTREPCFRAVSCLHQLCSPSLRNLFGRRTASFVSMDVPCNRRRPRPVWHDHHIHAGVSMSRSLASAEVHSRGDSIQCSSTSSGSSSNSNGSASDRARRRRAASMPLTHEQLPDESIYLLDGTSMLFKAFYGRGAGG